MRGPKVLGVGHAVDEVCQGLALAGRGVVDDDEVQQQAVDLVVFEGAQHLLGEARTVQIVHFEEEDGQVAADAEAPQSALRQRVLGQKSVAPVAEGGRLGYVFGYAVVEAHLAAFEEREACAHVVEHRGRLEGVFDVGRGGVLLRELEQLLPGFGEACEYESLGALASLDVEAAAHGEYGVEGGAHSAGEGASGIDDVGVAQAAAATEEVQARGLVFHQFALLAGGPQLVEQEVVAAVGAGTREEQRLVGVVVFRGHLHGVEDTVAFVLGGRGKHHLAVGRQFQVDGAGGVVGEGVAAYLGAAVLEYRDFGLRDDAVVFARKFDFVAGERDVVALRHHVERRVGGAPEVVALQVANVEEDAVVVGRDFAVAVEHRVAEARETAAAVVHQHGVLAVAHHADLRHIGYAVEVARVALGLHFAVLVALVLRHLEVDIGLHLCLLLEQCRHGAHGGVVHEENLQAVVAQVVGQRGQYHALVVGIVGADGDVVIVVVALEKSHVAVVHAQAAQQLKVVVDGAVVDADGQQRAVGRDDDAVRRGVLELEIGHPEGVVFVVLRVVELIVGCLADAPGQFLGVLDEGPLGADGETVGLVHQRVAEGGQEDEGHEVFEHRAVPRRHTLVSFILHQRLVEAEPVLVGRVALGYGEERGQSCLGGEIVVVVGEEAVCAVVVADAEDVEFGVVEPREVGLGYEPVYLGQQAVFQAVGHSEVFQVSLHHVETGHEIAAVGGADEEVGQFGQRVDIVPVVEVAVPFLQAFHGADDALQPLHGFLVTDEAQAGGADHRRQRVADVGGRCLVVRLVLAVLLVVVRDEPVGLLREHGVEEMPCVLGQLAHLPRLLLVEGPLVLGEFLAETVHDERRRHPHRAGHPCRHGGGYVGGREGRTTVAQHIAGHRRQCGGGHEVEPELLAVVAKRPLGALGGLVAGNPGQQVAV